MAEAKFVDNHRGIQSIEIRKDEELDDSKHTHTLEQAIEEISECASIRRERKKQSSKWNPFQNKWKNF